MSERKKDKIGRALGIDKVVMVSPNYKRIDLRKKLTNNMNFLNLEKKTLLK